MNWTKFINFNSIKFYIYSFVTFLIGLLGAFAAYQKHRADDLQNEVIIKEKELSNIEKTLKEENASKEQEQTQTEIVLKGEEEKQNENQKVQDFFDLEEGEEREILL